ncbi:hypothetical protein LINGRAHAP2_LOCUS28317, partial [Linum grandiflorum]
FELRFRKYIPQFGPPPDGGGSKVNAVKRPIKRIIKTEVMNPEVFKLTKLRNILITVSFRADH